MRNKARMGCISHRGGWASAISMAVIPDIHDSYWTDIEGINIKIPTKTPQVRSIVVGGVRILITSNNLGGHPVGGSNKRVPNITTRHTLYTEPDMVLPSSDSSVQLCGDAEVDQLDFSVVCQQYILSFDITMYHLIKSILDGHFNVKTTDLASMQMCQTP